MESRYKVIVSNKNLYKEIELPPQLDRYQIGTGMECDMRLRKELFFESICLTFVKKENEWTIQCSDNLYLSVGDVRKLLSKKLSHGETLEVKYQNSNNYVFSISFLIDFDSGQRKYERRINIFECSNIRIGYAADNDIVIRSPYIKNDMIELNKAENNVWKLTIKNTTYGVYLNGNMAKTNDLVKDKDFLSISDFFFYLKDQELWTEIKDNLIVHSLSYQDQPAIGSYPMFTRNTRLKLQVCEDKIEVLDPPAKPKKPKNNILMRLLPSMGMLVAGGVMAMYGGGMIIFSLISCGMAILTTVMSIRESNKEFKQSSQERIEKYKSYIENKKKEIDECRNKELYELDEIYIQQSREKQRFDQFSSELFDRTREDDDFLCIRLGSGDVKSKREINYKKQEKLEIEDDLQMIPENICKEYQNVHHAPIICDLKNMNALGIIGKFEYRFEFLKNIVVDLIARQYFTDMKLFFVAKEEHMENISWLRMLPHVYNDNLKIRNIVCNDESKNIIFEYLYKEMTLREQNKSYDYNIIVVFFDEYGFKSHPLSKFIDQAKDLGISFIFFGDKKSDVPQGCNAIVSIKGHKDAVFIDVNDKENATDFQYPIIDFQKAVQIVNQLAPVYIEEISLEGTLTKNISLFELLNIFTVDDIDLETRWSKSQVFQSMAAPIGISKSALIELDLHDKAHGPHGLVAGTTGSGKSEILQTYILSMATLYHPYEVGFVIIDFKGGGMVNQFKNLPHLLGAITNIDGKEINRSLKSIKAELQKRQRYFADAEVNHIDKYIHKYKNHEVSEPLPHLIIIVDEFAELKAEQPEFMKELISAARIGRSLGVHLILATQKPSGQVNEQIWSNSRFKLCLKVQSQEDSNEVLKSPLAAEIKEPGRAYLQVGNNEIFELFQSAYSGAPEKSDDTKVKEFSIYQFTNFGKRLPVYIQKKKKSDGDNVTQLDAIVSYVSKYCEKNNLSKLPDICLPSLKTVIEYSNDFHDELTVPVGVYDDPDNQLQETFGINIFSENTIIIGSTMTGKTNLLQLIIRGAADNFSPNEVTMYIVDFASMVLKNFEKLKHVGGVVVSNEDEKLKNLFKLLNEEIAIRKEKLLTAGVSNFIAYKEAGNIDLPQIVLLIDNLTALKELYFAEDDFLLPICRDGISVGVSVIIANSQTSGIGYKYFSNINQRIAFTCNDPSEYHSVFEHCKMQPENLPGRCLIQREKVIYEAQTFISFEGEKEFERVQEISKFIEEINENHTSSAKKIPVVPELLLSSMLQEEYNVASDTNKLIIGLDFANVTPVGLDYAHQDVLAISGSYMDSKYNFINYLKSSFASLGPEMYVLDDYSGMFGDISDDNNVLLYSKNIEDIDEMLINLKNNLVERYAARDMYGIATLEKMKPIILIINAIDAIGYISENKIVLETYKEIVKKYKNLKSLILFTNVENETIAYSSPEVLKMMKDNYQFIVFEDLNAVKIFDCPMSLLKKFKTTIKDNEAYFLSGNDLKKIKTVLR